MPGTNTLYGHEDGVSAAGQVNAVLAFFNATKANQHTGLTIFVDGEIEHVDSTNGQVIATENTGAGGTAVGVDASDVLPYATQMLVQLRTGVFFGGRELRGRFFIPGFCEDNSIAGVPSAGILASVQSAATTLVGAAQLAVFSPTKFQWAAVNAAPVWNEWAVLRSRRD